MSQHPVARRLEQAVADPATAYLLRAFVWFVALLGLLRLSWVQATIVLPYTRLQAGLAEALLGEKLRVLIAASCSGSDAMAICLGAILAFPVPWRRRLLAAAGGLALITAVNTVRIAHLSHVAADAELLELLHRKVWPGLIILVAAGYAFAWMRSAGSPGRAGGRKESEVRRPSAGLLRAGPTAALATLFVALYYGFYERLLTSPLLAGVAGYSARMAGGLMSFCGLPSQVGGGVLQTPGATWIVTPECVTTPLIPISLAVALAARASWRARLLAVAALPLVFQLLAVARLMVLAVPRALIGSPMIAVHAFYQFVLALVVVGWTARRHRPGARRAGRAVGLGVAAGLTVGLVDLQLLRPALAGVATRLHLGHGYADPQGALLLMPAFQIGLLVALWALRRERSGGGRLPLLTTLVAGAGVVLVVVLGELAVHAAVEAPIVVIRVWSLALPLLLVGALGWRARRREKTANPPSGALSPAA